jgi:phosphatidylserine decarboxylase
METELMGLPLARYGWAEILVAVVGLAVLSIPLALTAPWTVCLPVVALAFLLYFFRDPRREIPGEAGAIVSPADGTVTDVDVCDEPQYLRSPALRIGIFLSVFDVHVNRAPVGGRVAYLDYRRGRFLSALRFDRCSRENERNSVGLETEAVPGGRVLVRQIAGAFAQRIVCACGPGVSLARGERFGMIKFGSRTELYLPRPNSLEVRVHVGDHVKGGETILAVVRAAESCGEQKGAPCRSSVEKSVESPSSRPS